MSRIGKAILLLALLAAGLWLAWGRQRPVIEGYAWVVDGDSLRVSGVDIRLKGVDAPELGQRCTRDSAPYACGESARAALMRRLAGHRLACRIEGRDRYRRALAVCFASGGDIGAWLVEEGFAVGYRGYDREEARARGARRNLWAGEFQRPSLWRRDNDRVPTS